MIFAAQVAKKYKGAFEELSTKLMMKCLNFYLESTDRNFPGGDSAEILDELMEVGRSTLQLSGNQNLFLITDYFIFADWGDLVYFDMDKLQAGIRRIQIPNLQRQWKISFSIYRGYASDIRLQTLPNQPYNSPLASLTLTFGPLPDGD